jgi:cytochrome b6-f complex iron-sulfur subunit
MAEKKKKRIELPPEADSGDVSRRAFTQVAVGGVGACYAAAIGYPVYRYLATPAREAASLAAVSEVALPKAQLPEAGSALMFRFGTKPAMLIHHADGTMVCFNAICTHLACTVQYQPEEGRIYCACHGGQYDPHTGQNVAGPPPKPLTPYRVEVSDENVIIHRA